MSRSSPGVKSILFAPYTWLESGRIWLRPYLNARGQTKEWDARPFGLGLRDLIFKYKKKEQVAVSGPGFQKGRVARLCSMFKLTESGFVLFTFSPKSEGHAYPCPS